MRPVDCFIQDMIRNCLSGEVMKSRNGHKTYRALTPQIASFNETPLVSLRATAWKNALREWEWFMSGATNINSLDERVRHWWSPWVGEDDCVNYNYSQQFRTFNGIDGDDCWDTVDQIKYIVDGIRNNPTSRRLVATTWNAYDMTRDDCPITNCHGTAIQFFVRDNGRLDMNMYQRSADLVLGVPHNWIQYWAFLQWVAAQTHHKVGRFVWIGGDVHVYEDHLEVAKEMCQVDQQKEWGNLDLTYNPTDVSIFRADDFAIAGEYQPLITTKLKMNV